MIFKEAIKAIRDNYPPSHYTMLREALDMSIEALEITEWARWYCETTGMNLDECVKEYLEKVTE